MMPHQQVSPTSYIKVGDEEEIIRSFENDTFLKNYKKNIDQNSTVKLKMDNLLLWLNSDFIPNFLTELPNFTKKEVKECLNKTEMIQGLFGTLFKSMERKGNNSGFTYICSKCNVTIKNSAERSVSVALQQHQHIEEAFAYSCSVTEDSSTTQVRPIVVNYCDNCSALVNIPTNFKFSFNISYHPDVERFLYMHNFTNEVIVINNLNLFTMQLKDMNLCLCLLCVRDFSVKLAQEHIRGQRHAKNKMTSTAVNTFLSYHRNWLMQESCYQAHQIYLNPFSEDAAICSLCDNMHVPYGVLQNHIKDEYHKFKFFKIEDTNVLLKLQKKVYISKQLENELPHIAPTVEQYANTEEPSTSTFCLQADSQNGNSDDDSDLGESDDVSTGIQEENKSTAVHIHEIIKSIATDSTVELHNFLEHRFWPHFDKVMRIYGTKVECNFCKISLDKNYNIVIQHIISNNHQKCAEIPKKFYRFYCEICNTWIRYDHNWFVHMKNEKHRNRCQKLGDSRRKKLTEYECKSCKHIIFGDDISVKRHTIMARSGRKRRPNRVVLDKKIVEMFMKEENIITEANKLVKDAEEVLLNRANVIECCNAIKEALMETYPNCNVHPFGSQVSGLGSKRSDLDLFVDLGNMYLGDKSQDSTSQVRIVTNVMKIFAKKKDEFQHLNPIPRARTPIIQVYHVKTRLDCDLSFRHGLSVENTKFLRLCIEVQACTQSLILLLKQWLDYTKLAHRHITTYSLAMMVIFYLQINNYLLPVHELRQLSSKSQIIIDGWCIMDLSSLSVEELKKQTKPCDKSIKEMLTNFFLYYKNFNYSTEIICPLLGRPVKKPCLFQIPKDLTYHWKCPYMYTRLLLTLQTCLKLIHLCAFKIHLI